MKKKINMPTSYTILLVLTFIVAILTFIVPAGQYKYSDGMPIAGTYALVEQNPQGLWDIFMAPIKGFISAIDIITFIIILGGCLGIIFETRAIDAALEKVIKKLDGKEKMIIPIIMIICAIGGTTYGMSEETIAFYPIILPILITAGYDVVTGVMVIFLGSAVGIGAGIVNPFSVGIGSNLAGISLGDGIVVRVVLFISYLCFALFYTMRYAEKIKKDPSKSLVYDISEETNGKFRNKKSDENIELDFNPERKKVITIFGLMFLIMIIGIIPWENKFNIHIFGNIHKAIVNLPVLGDILGNSLALGEWHFKEMTMLFLVGGIAIGKVYGYKEKEMINLFLAGAKDILSVALILGLAKGLSVVMKEGVIIDTLLNYGEQFLVKLKPELFLSITYLLYIPLSLFIPSSSGLQTATIPILAPLADFVGIDREYVVMACQAGAETMNFISPTQAVIIGALTLTNIPYERWLKHIFPFFLGIIVITIVVLVGANIVF